MNPTLIIARFELLYQLRQPAFYLFAAVVFGQGIWYAGHLSDEYAYSDPTTIGYLMLASLRVPLAAITVLLAGQSLTKDLDYNTTSFFFTLPITSRQHIIGRLIGAYSAALLVAALYPVGTTVFFSFHSISIPALWVGLADGFIRLIAQNIFIVVSLTFALTVLLKSIRGAYSSLFLILLYFLLSESGSVTVDHADLWKLLDPFGTGMARESIEDTYFGQEPAALLVFSDMFFINRLLWLGLALGLLTFTEQRFSFDYFIGNESPTLGCRTGGAGKSSVSPGRISARSQSGFLATGRTITHLIKWEISSLIRQPIFTISLGVLTLLTILAATIFNVNPDFPELPVTSHMTSLRLTVGLLISLFVLVMTIESLFMERTVGIAPLSDTFPHPTFVLLLPKVCAMVFVTASLTFTLFLTGVSVQLSRGFSEINWQLYLIDLVPDGFLRYCQLIALGGLVATLVNNRLASHFISLLIFSLLFFGYQLNTSSVFLYSFLPGSATYSDLTGYGAKADLRLLVHLIWWAVAGVFITLLFLTWNRGSVTTVGERIKQGYLGFQWSYVLIFILFGAMLSFLLWRLQAQQPIASIRSASVIQYRTHTLKVSSISGHPTAVSIQYYHPYQLQHLVQAVKIAIRRGEQLFGTYPHSHLTIVETPNGEPNVASAPGRILISEKQGWIADNKQPDKLDYVDYLLSREIFNQWLVHRLHPTDGLGNGFVKQSLAEYLALQTITNQYGPEKLRQRLAQRARWYAKTRQLSHVPEPSLLESSGNDAVERGRAALVLTSIGQAWGDKPLSLTIGQFYKKAIQRPSSATASSFVSELSRQLPDSLHYLQTYLRDPVWFDFKIGRIAANQVNGISVEIQSKKWQEKPDKARQVLPINDYVPIAVLDRDGRQLYRQLIHSNRDDLFVSLPVIPNAYQVVLDPVGAWPEANKRDNAKIL